MHPSKQFLGESVLSICQIVQHFGLLFLNVFYK